MLTIDAYTGNWQAAMKPTAPEIGAEILIAYHGDVRELYDMERCLTSAGRRMRYTGTGDKFVVIKMTNRE